MDLPTAFECELRKESKHSSGICTCVLSRKMLCAGPVEPILEV